MGMPTFFPVSILYRHILFCLLVLLLHSSYRSNFFNDFMENRILYKNVSHYFSSFRCPFLVRSFHALCVYSQNTYFFLSFSHMLSFCWHRNSEIFIVSNAFYPLSLFMLTFYLMLCCFAAIVVVFVVGAAAATFAYAHVIKE